MAVNTRFATGVHTLILLAAEAETKQTSEDIARQLNTNPVVIRRVLSLLRKAGLITSRKGSNGGAKLAKPGKTIRLGDVYRALEPGSLFHGSAASGANTASVTTVLTKIFHDAQAALEVELDAVTLAQLAKKSAKHKK